MPKRPGLNCPGLDWPGDEEEEDVVRQGSRKPQVTEFNERNVSMQRSMKNHSTSCRILMVRYSASGEFVIGQLWMMNAIVDMSISKETH